MSHYLTRISLALICFFQISDLALAVEVKQVESAATTTPGAIKAATELVEVLVDKTRSTAMADTLINAATNELVTKNSDVAALNAAFPGLDGAFRSAMAAPMKNEVARVLPLYRNELVQFYASRLSESDIRETNRFFRSPVGAALLMSLQQSVGMSNTATELAANKEATAASLKSDQAVAGVRAIFSLSPEQQKEVGAFFGSPTGKRVTALSEARAAIDIKWFNYVSPEGKAEVESAVQQALVSHVAKTDPKTAEAIRAAMEAQTEAEK